MLLATGMRRRKVQTVVKMDVILVRITFTISIILARYRIKRELTRSGVTGMGDKVEIAAQNCWISENQDIRTDVGRVVKEAYIRGFKRGVEKAKKAAANGRENVVGEWIQHYETTSDNETLPYGWECSLCGRWEMEKEPFCNCGAKMEATDEV